MQFKTGRNKNKIASLRGKTFLKKEGLQQRPSLERGKELKIVRKEMKDRRKPRGKLFSRILIRLPFGGRKQVCQKLFAGSEQQQQQQQE